MTIKKLRSLIKFYIIYFSCSFMALAPNLLKIPISESIMINYGIFAFLYMALFSVAINISADPNFNILIGLIAFAALISSYVLLTSRWRTSYRCLVLVILLGLNFYRNIIVLNS